MSIQVSSTLNLATTAATERKACLASLLRQRSNLNEQGLGSAAVWLQKLRNQAADQLQAASIPSTRDEEWRFTDLSALVKTEFEVGSRSPQASLQDLAALTLPEAANSRLVFINGVYAPELSATADLPEGIQVGNLSDPKLQPIQSRLSQYLAQQPGAEEVFTALNTASFTDAAIVWVPKNLEVETPIHLLFLSLPESAPTVSHPRCLVVAESNSSLTLVEDYGAIAPGPYFTNTVTEIWVDENAQVNHSRIQRDRPDAFHIGKTVVSQARDSRYTCNAISLGAKLSRHNLDVFQTGEQTHTVLNGLTLIGGEQLADTHSLIAYAKPHGSSQQLHKCIVDDRAHAVFNGKVSVPQAAQLTDAGQLNRNLLLSPKARVDTKPQLEIVADNVKCTHGATVSQLDSDEVFYLQSRGIDADSAQSLLIYAFAFEVISQLPIDSLRDSLSQTVSAQTE